MRLVFIVLLVSIAAACGDDEPEDGDSTAASSSASTSSGTGGTGGGVDCSNVGCGAPPLCSEGCTQVCGCCSCPEGELVPPEGGGLVCRGGCYVPVEGAGGGGGEGGAGGGG